ncbi:MAG TPA: hypothetical protein VFQ67_14025 [Allosphingosinicella sp.]|jgi:hypothetical protein|nr:hypothetical protein [Allosphingosinicella sp.]
MNGPTTFLAAPLLALALSAAAPAPAPARDAGRAEEILGQMPKDLDGARSMRLADGIITYFPKRLGQDPMFGVIVAGNDDVDPPEKIREFVRDTFHESGIREVVREGTFTTARWPGAATFFGEYVTGAGFKQSWTVMTGKEHVTVLTTYFNRKDAKRVEALVAENIFGGAVISATQGGSAK